MLVKIGIDLTLVLLFVRIFKLIIFLIRFRFFYVLDVGISDIRKKNGIGSSLMILQQNRAYEY